MHQLAFPLLVGLIIVALAFDFLNGLHDAANSIATVVGTRLISPVWAVAFAAFFNFAAYFLALQWPWSTTAREHPFPGLLYAELLSGHNLIVYLAAVLVPVSAWVLYRTRHWLYPTSRSG